VIPMTTSLQKIMNSCITKKKPTEIARWITFELEFLNNAVFPAWKGRVIRGAVGNILKKLFCDVRIQECENCPKNRLCPYGFLFRPSSQYLFLKNLKYFPKPFSLKPPLEKERVYKKGSTLKFSIVLFGQAISYIGVLISAIQSLCLIGIGKKEKRGKFRIRAVYLENPFRNKKEVLFENGTYYKTKTSITDSDIERKIRKDFKITFLTPFRLIRENSLVADPDFQDLFSFMSRKYSNILQAYCGLVVKEDFSKLKEFAQGIQKISSNLRKMLFIYTKNGKKYQEYYLIGDIHFYSPSKLKKRIRRIINFGILSNIGKRTTFGHGWYRVE